MHLTHEVKHKGHNYKGTIRPTYLFTLQPYRVVEFMGFLYYMQTFKIYHEDNSENTLAYCLIKYKISRLLCKITFHT